MGNTQFRPEETALKVNVNYSAPRRGQFTYKFSDGSEAYDHAGLLAISDGKTALDMTDRDVIEMHEALAKYMAYKGLRPKC